MGERLGKYVSLKWLSVHFGLISTKPLEIIEIMSEKILN